MPPNDITSNDVAKTKTLSIRDCGKDEQWLQNKIYEDPTILGLGELQPVMKEKTQTSGGRLDLLLKNPENDSMFEVEIQLGATDEAHIIRTIEYWNHEQRRWPNRRHTAVLVAEAINNRFFNVVHLLSMAVPIIGIQANIIDLNGCKGLHFTKIIDSNEEPEESESTVFDEKHWRDKYPWVLACAKWYEQLLENNYGDVQVKYFDLYISLAVGGAARVWITQRKEDRAFIEVRHGEDRFQEAVDYLNSSGLSPSTNSSGLLKFNVNLTQLEDKAAAHQWLVARLVPKNVKLES